MLTVLGGAKEVVAMAAEEVLMMGQTRQLVLLQRVVYSVLQCSQYFARGMFVFKQMLNLQLMIVLCGMGFFPQKMEEGELWTDLQEKVKGNKGKARMLQKFMVGD